MMKFVTYNIHFGVGTDGRLDLQRIADTVRHADVIALQEVEVNWDRSNNTDQPKEISSRLPDHEFAWGPTIDVWKHDKEAGGVIRGKRRQFGNMLLSRYPIVSVKNYLLPKYGGVQYTELQRGALEAVIDTPAGFIRVYSIHLCNLSEVQRELQVDLLLQQHARAAKEGPVLHGRHADDSWTKEPPLPETPADAIWLGDFNSEPTGRCYPKIVGEYNRRVGHIARRGGFVDAWALANRQSPSKDENSDRGGTVIGDGRRIDYCFLSTELADRLVSAEVMMEADGSDHRPITVVLRQ